MDRTEKLFVRQSLAYMLDAIAAAISVVLLKKRFSRSAGPRTPPVYIRQRYEDSE